MEKPRKKDELTPLLDCDHRKSINDSWIHNVTVEPVAFMHSFGWSLSEIILTNQIVYQTCLVTLDGPDEESCSIMKQTGATDNETLAIYLEQKVQPYAATVTMTIVLLTSVVPALVALFLGPWSDKFGRKPVIAIASTGNEKLVPILWAKVCGTGELLVLLECYLISEVLVAWVCYMSSYYVLSPWWYVVANIPVSISGGYSVFNAGIFSYMSDVTHWRNRTLRMGVLQGCTMFGVLVGLLASSYMIGSVSAAVMFSISAAAMLASIVYLAVVTKETIAPESTLSRTDKVKEIFNINLLLEMFQTFTKSRPNYERAITWLLISVGGLVEFAVAGRQLFFLYTRRQFGWDAVNYGFWLSAELGLIMLGNLFGIGLLKKWFNISDLSLLALSTMNQLGDYLIKGFAQEGWQLYLTTLMTPFKGVDGAAIRSILSSILPRDDIGKSYSMDLSVKAITPLISVFLFTFIYNRTIDDVPSTYLFVTSGIFGINLLLIGISRHLLKRRHRENL